MVATNVLELEMEELKKINSLAFAGYTIICFIFLK